MSELRKWIEDAIKEEKLAASHTESLHTDPSAQNLQLPGVGLGGGGGKSSTTKKAGTKGNKTSTQSMKKGSTTLNTTQPADISKKQLNNLTHNTSAFSNPSIDEFASKGSGKYKMLKHQMPGNNLLTEAE